VGESAVEIRQAVLRPPGPHGSKQEHVEIPEPCEQRDGATSSGELEGWEERGWKGAVVVWRRLREGYAVVTQGNQQEYVEIPEPGQQRDGATPSGE
jgi:hypothetical protein